MPKTTFHVNRVMRSPQALNAFIEVVRPYLPLTLEGTRITEDDILYVLTHASVHRLSLDAACAELDAASSANRLREVLGAALPQRPRPPTTTEYHLAGAVNPGILERQTCLQPSD